MLVGLRASSLGTSPQPKPLKKRRPSKLKEDKDILRNPNLDEYDDGRKATLKRRLSKSKEDKDILSSTVEINPFERVKGLSNLTFTKLLKNHFIYKAFVKDKLKLIDRALHRGIFMSCLVTL